MLDQDPSDRRATPRGIGVVVSIALAFPLFASLAAAEDRVHDWSVPSDDQCTPTCREGYECERGECHPICQPECAPGLLCTASGECVRVDSQVAAPRQRARERQPGACEPSCRSGFTCIDGACVSQCNPVCARNEFCSAYDECLPRRDEQPAPEPEPTPQAPARGPRKPVVALYVDALSALQFGLDPTVEVGRRVTGWLSFRALNAGLSSYFALGRDDEDEFQWGLGAATGLHVLSARSGHPHGFYGGPLLEYAFAKTQDVKRDRASYRTHWLVPGVDFGHRWHIDGMLLGVGLRLGVAIPVAEDAEPIGIDGCRQRDSCSFDRKVRFLPALTLDLGAFFPRD